MMFHVDQLILLYESPKLKFDIKTNYLKKIGFHV